MQILSNQRVLFIAAASFLGVVLVFAYTKADEMAFSPKTIIAFGADADQEKAQPLWETILSSNPDVFLFLGDNVYIDSGDEKIMREKYAKLSSIPEFKKFFEKNIPIVATWDDHDFGVDDGGANFPQKKISQKVFLDFFKEPNDSVRRKQKGIYDAKIFGSPGKQVQIIALDTRYFRNATTLLGEDQWKWLETELRRPAEVRLMMSSIQVISKNNGWENWMNVPSERKRLFHLIRETEANGVIFLSGDRHFGELSIMDGGVGYPLYDLTTGSLNKASKKSSNEKNQYRVKNIVEPSESFGLITIDWGWINPPQILFEIKGLNGDATIQRKIPLAILQRGVLPLAQE